VAEAADTDICFMREMLPSGRQNDSRLFDLWKLARLIINTTEHISRQQFSESQ